ncbi:hypothetical protein DF139_04920 [Burkholderia stagnalis]|uniref:hypothetical protein n=1 Tax=Burkholderia stagnalis TaxID=1503054 RepID=UPI000F58C493|nr:hypothetical protein [Burkholderia stagnalis]RQQ73114.1 hypothetical protein DF137_04565 [Burkholderia stagnalis]RQQ74599.1 hypothetical protein DF139_04920 [Burkholderia stagnalis]RQQ86759.1 hypothetical protein DF138_01290 [Burkholderia stagnalis]RQQ95499.1 hypothetical protein DF136_05045 [Burkholderia stagnalis]
MQTLILVPIASFAESLSYDERVAYLNKISAADVRADVFVRSAVALGFRVTWDHANGTPILAWLH